MRTTISINDAILKDLRTAASKAGVPFRQVVQEALQVGLRNLTTSSRQSRFRITTYPLHTKAAFRAVPANQLYDQLEAEQDRR
jgi:hypothetical protein